MSHRAGFVWLLVRLSCLAMAVAGFVSIAGCGRSDLDIGPQVDGGLLPDVVGGNCSPQTCPTGCCDANGQCQPGTTVAACGTSGASCLACSPGNTCFPQTQSCGAVTACNAATCPGGCCDANGACQPGSSLNACGTAGTTCENCPSLGFGTCDSATQQCENVVTVCDGNTCSNGCCESNGGGGFLCVAGTQDSTCGSGGEQCQDCSNFGLVCDPNARQCTMAQCGPENCGGCCLGNQCITGDNQNACGAGGQQCQNCGPTGSCSNGICTTTTSCSPQNCPGCCDAMGICEPGQTQFACGQGGQQCQPCPPNLTCQFGFCQPNQGQCGPQNCPGCCDFNGVCQGGGQPFECGQGGQSCFSCPPETTCQFGTCQPLMQFCGPQNCPGCCDGNGVCQAGMNTSQCGGGGQLCESCPQNFFCKGGLCVEPLPNCTPQDCQGCCIPGPMGGSLCTTGDNPTECGQGGQQCQVCPPNSTCQFGLCQQQPLCGPQNCGGCCQGNTCVPGDSSMQCGQGGQQCFPCPPPSSCQFGFCQISIDAGGCGPFNCNGCCDANGVCQGGNSTGNCGTGGQQCTICPPQTTCNGAGICTSATPCNASNCAGCCDVGNICEAGFIDTACGSGGAACNDCTLQNSNCDTAVTPRTCASQQMLCPAPYAGCPAGTTTPTPTQQAVCPASDLANADAACQSGPSSPSCLAFFLFEKTQDPACYSCLTPFDVDYFSDLTGIFLCVAPFVDSTCNGDTGCTDDCVHKSCDACPASSESGCEMNALNNACSQFVNNDSCAFNALGGAASFCQPNSTFGDWLDSVGQFYCAQ